MPKANLKLTEQTAVVKVTGTTAETIALNTDILDPRQEVTGTARANIVSITWVTQGNTTIVRGGTNIMTLPAGVGQINLMDYLGAVDNVNNNSNIVVTIATGGSVYIQLRKVDGYSSKIEDYRFGQYDNPNVVGA